ncbi:MAG: GPR1/FUN34/YaaH family transporter [Acidimicrobiales bacterium]
MESAEGSRERMTVIGDPRAAPVALLFFFFFVVVVVLLGMHFTQAIPATSIFLFLPVLFFAGVVQFVIGMMGVAKGENVIGMFFCVFGAFLMSFPMMVFGLTHAWWAIVPASIPHAEAAFLIGWTVILTVWLLLSVVLPIIFTLLLIVIDISLWALVYGVWNSSAGAQKFAGYSIFAAAVGAIYIFASWWLEWVGRPILSHGPPLLKPSAAKTPASSVTH